MEIAHRAESAATEALRSRVGPFRPHAEPDRAPVPGGQDTCQGPAGTSAGVNIAPGSNDDGWIVPEPVALADGTQVQLYKDGEALHAAFAAIEAARRRVLLEVYIWGGDDTGRAFADLLCRKARAGVGCYVLYDSVGSIATDPDIFRRMKRAGVRVEEFHPWNPWETRFAWRPLLRNHRKLLVIDDDIAGLGGLNVGGEYAGSWVVQSASPGCELWRDNAVGIRGPGARMFVQAFAKSWHYVTQGGRIARAEHSQNLDGSDTGKASEAGAGSLGVLASVPTVNSPLRPFLHKLFREARRSILMTMAYFAPDDPLVASLATAARRGVRVRLMLPGKSDVPLLQIAARSFYEMLMTFGVEIYERQGVVLHSKTLVIDGRTTLIGSTNLDYRSIEYNLEISALIRSEPFGQQMHTLFENDVKFARKINLGEWRHRPQWDRFVQWTVSRARYLL